jgi:autotransporter-associated beta strand protein
MRGIGTGLLGLLAVLGTAAAAAAATTTQLVLSPDQPTAAAIAEAPALADRTTFDLVITTSADWTNSSLKFVLSDGSFYNATGGGNVPTTPDQWSTPGFRRLRYDTFVAGPPDFTAVPLIISRHPSDGGGSAIFSAAAVSVLWADTDTSYGPGTYTIARLTVSNDAVGSFFGSTFDNSLPGEPQPFNGAINKQLRWDADPLVSGAQGGTGTWNTTGKGFWNGAVNVAWDNARNDVAIFGASGGTVTVGSVTAGALRFDTAGYTLTGGTIALTGSGQVTANQDAAVNSTVVSAGGLTKRGAAKLTLSGDNTYSGPTTVSEGTLLVSNAAGSGTGTGSVTVKAGGTLGGAGTITGAVAVNAGGILAPGGSAGTLKVGTEAMPGSVAMDANAVYKWEFNGTAGDLVAIRGDLTLNPGWKLALADVGGTPASGVEYDLFTYTGSFGGSIAAVIDAGGVTWPAARIAQDATVGAGRIYLTFNLLGDTNNDGVVDAADYVVVKRHMGQSTGAGAADGDFDGDGTVDWDDLQTLMTNFGAGIGAATATTPEPGSAVLLMFATAAMLRRRHKQQGPVIR